TALVDLVRDFNALLRQIGPQRLYVGGLQGNVEQALVLVGRQAGKDLDVLPVIHLEVRQRQAAVLFADLEGLVVTQQLAVKGARLGQVAYLKSDVGNADNRRPFGRPAKAAQCGKDSDHQRDYSTPRGKRHTCKLLGVKRSMRNDAGPVSRGRHS